MCRNSGHYKKTTPSKLGVVAESLKSVVFCRSTYRPGRILVRPLFTITRIFRAQVTVEVIIMPVPRWAYFTPGHQVIHLFSINGFIFHECIFHGFKDVAVFFQYLLSTGVALINYPTNFLIYEFGCLVRILLRGHTRISTFLFTIMKWPQFGRQTPLGHHTASQVSGTLNIIGCSGGDTVKTKCHFLCDTPTEQCTDARFK